MKKYGRYDGKAAETTQVLGWYDTAVFDYGERLPPAANLIEVTDAQWDQRHEVCWGVQPGKAPKLVPFERKAEGRPEFAAQARYWKALSAGVQVKSAGKGPSGAYGVEEADRVAIQTELQFIGSFGEFSSDGARELPWTLLDGKTRVSFTSTEQFQAFAKGALRYATALLAARAAAAAGGDAAWPDPNITIP